MLEEAIVSYLGADAAVVALIGTPITRSDCTNGIYPVIAVGIPVMPYIALQQATGEALQTSFQGTGRLQTERWRISCYGSSYKSAKTLARAVKLALFSFNGQYSAAAVVVQGSWLRLEADEAEPSMNATVFATIIDFEFNFIDAG